MATGYRAPPPADTRWRGPPRLNPSPPGRALTTAGIGGGRARRLRRIPGATWSSARGAADAPGNRTAPPRMVGAVHHARGSCVVLAKGRLWTAYLIVFLSSACTLVLEIVAGRLLAPYVGVSLYTWTSIIGVVLAGITVGNYLGGILADRRPHPTTLGALLLASGIASLGVLLLSGLLAPLADAGWP